jgi:hypothetical protein
MTAHCWLAMMVPTLSGKWRISRNSEDVPPVTVERHSGRWCTLLCNLALVDNHRLLSGCADFADVV